MVIYWGGQRERERDRERERERKREEESTLLWLSSLARVRLHLRCFGYIFFFLSFLGGGAILGFSLANLEVRLPKVKFFLKIKSHKEKVLNIGDRAFA